MLLKFINYLIFFSLTNGLKTIPDYIDICKRTDPKVEECLIKSVENLRDRLKMGIPELGVPAIEPIQIENITIIRNDINTSFYLDFTNILVTGASGFEIVYIKAKTQDNTYDMDIKIPYFHVVGDYDVDIKLLSMPIKGNGKFILNTSINQNILSFIFEKISNSANCEGEGTIKTRLIQADDGHREIRFESWKFNVNIGDFSAKVEHYNQGDKGINDFLNNMMAHNKKLIKHSSMGYIQWKLEEVLLDFSNQIAKDIDYDIVFPE